MAKVTGTAAVRGGLAVAAVDLGASSGRVMVGRLGPGTLELTEAHRFANEPVRLGATLHWDILALYAGVLRGLRAAGPVAGVGIDSWAVDYGLLDASGALLGNPVHYRDARTDGLADRVADKLGRERLYAVTGLQHLPFNTLYQLAAAAGTPQYGLAERLLLIPDLLAYWLTGEVGAEVTNASTTQLYDLHRRTWAAELMTEAGLRPELMAPLREPGTRIGPVRPETGLPGSPEVVAVASHDTASAVVAVPASGERFAYISCGTWSLVGVELDRPVLSEAGRRANFTNETGVDGTIRYLRNVMGLWLLQESMRAWGLTDPADLLRRAADRPAFASVVDVDDPVFMPPGDMPGRIADACRATGQPVPETPAATVRCIVDSLALAHRRAVRQAQELSGRHVEVVHVVGGGARNALLCQLTADACGLPVVAGPVEATALGNVLIQARAAGAAGPGLPELRALVRDTQHLIRYEPRGDSSSWAAAEARLERGNGPR
ncbi:rhamnulokinase [Planomonospora venezuelensis]|uniref:Rhamnulokinase n=1 Tax=Planomonospora venezuelensis TaxID=1999 RepID=A0A841D0E5_PLAVE|nr:rhamnulokinase family protein [Planomonospora venezuelensis]MBB5962473.1 rhamnulokinase [Planomonospora venezuelensis]GIN00856.1 carbohydrate kinase [Planomonospora venezuelensis]